MTINPLKAPPLGSNRHRAESATATAKHRGTPSERAFAAEMLISRSPSAHGPAAPAALPTTET